MALFTIVKGMKPAEIAASNEVGHLLRVSRLRNGLNIQGTIENQVEAFDQVEKYLKEHGVTYVVDPVARLGLSDGKQLQTRL